MFARPGRGAIQGSEPKGVPMPREIAILACTECKRRNYMTTRNKKTMTDRVELKKFCPHERRHTVHREVK